MITAFKKASKPPERVFSDQRHMGRFDYLLKELSVDKEICFFAEQSNVFNVKTEVLKLEVNWQFKIFLK